MKKLLISIILITVCAGAGFAYIHTIKTDNRQGCCSHHGGVCGCKGGRALCCDGSLSPSCGCY